MKKSIIIIGFLLAVVLFEVMALIHKSKNPSPVEFALDEQEYDLLINHARISPFVFETDFVEQVDASLAKISDEMNTSFGVYLSDVFGRLTKEQQQAKENAIIRKQKLDEFRQAMASEPVAVRGSYLGDNRCEVDGVQGICADGVYKLGKHCIACFEGVCAGAKCADDEPTVAEDTAEAAEADTLAESPVEEDVAEVVAEEAAEIAEKSEPQEEIVADSTTEEDDDISQILAATPDRAEQPAEVEAGEEVAAPEIIVLPEVIAVPEVKTEDKPAEEVVAAKEETLEVKSEPVVAKEENNNNKEVLIAVVIDDVGLSVPFTNQIAKINYPLTVSFLPYGASDKAQVQKLKNAGFEVMLHVPMMPRVPADLAPITLSPQMSKAEIQEKLLIMMDRFAGTGMNGINNHMGSAFTESREAMSAVMEVLHDRKMYFLDSKTTSRSVGRFVSKEYNIPYVARDVFLDNERKYDYIMGQFRATERVARNKGYAIAIGHPYSQTLQVLRDWLKDVEKRGIKIVPLSDLVAKLNN
jgi:polysaccharide deacetylase 2 family uncharacterized protein YibQ